MMPLQSVSMRICHIFNVYNFMRVLINWLIRAVLCLPFTPVSVHWGSLNSVQSQSGLNWCPVTKTAMIILATGSLWWAYHRHYIETFLVQCRPSISDHRMWIMQAFLIISMHICFVLFQMFGVWVFYYICLFAATLHFRKLMTTRHLQWSWIVNTEYLPI